MRRSVRMKRCAGSSTMTRLTSVKLLDISRKAGPASYIRCTERWQRSGGPSVMWTTDSKNRSESIVDVGTRTLT